MQVTPDAKVLPTWQVVEGAGSITQFAAALLSVTLRMMIERPALLRNGYVLTPQNSAVVGEVTINVSVGHIKTASAGGAWPSKLAPAAKAPSAIAKEANRRRPLSPQAAKALITSVTPTATQDPIGTDESPMSHPTMGPTACAQTDCDARPTRLATKKRFLYNLVI